MSFAALAWAAKQRPGNLAAKMVLFGLANYADEHGCAYPSTAALAEFGDMDPKTATAALDRLIEMGLIADSGDRAGRTKQIKVYRLSLESLPKTEASQKRKPSASPNKDPQKRGTDTVTEPITLVGSNEPTSPPELKNGKLAASIDQLQEAWNVKPASRGAIECRRLGPERRRKATTFLRRYPIEDITEAIEAVARSDFLCGRGEKDFRADIEFLFSPKHMNRLIEGFYDR